METEIQWCDNAFCPYFGRTGAHNIKVYSYAERRFYCTTCQRTFSADKGTFFETLRTPRPLLLDVVAMLVERNSLRAISRIKHCKVDAVLHWLDLAGQQAATVSRHFIRGLRLQQAQIDELWTFIKKNSRTCNRATRRSAAMPGSGAPSRCPVICVSSPISRTSGANWKRRPFWRPLRRALTGNRHCSPVISSRLMSKR